MTDEKSVGIGSDMDIVDSVGIGIDGNASATEDTSRDMNVVDSCMHVCVNKNVNVNVDRRITKVIGETLMSAEVWGRFYKHTSKVLIALQYAVNNLEPGGRKN